MEAYGLIGLVTCVVAARLFVGMLPLRERANTSRAQRPSVELSGWFLRARRSVLIAVVVFAMRIVWTDDMAIAEMWLLGG